MNDVLLLASVLVGSFIFYAIILTDDVDDDDGPSGGLMTPVYAPSQN